MDDFKKDLIKNLMSEIIDKLKIELINMLFDKVDSKYFELYLNSLSDNFLKMEIARLESKIDSELSRIGVDKISNYEISQIKKDLSNLLKRVEMVEKKIFENKDKSKSDFSPPQDIEFQNNTDIPKTYICPVENISWYDAQQFIERLNSMTDGKYRLPYEAEWEYSASWAGEGKKHKWAGTDNESEIKDYAWYEDNSGGKTHPLGQKKPNALGLYDMIGNVWEWCMDWYDKKYYSRSHKKNPTGPNSGDRRVMQGGSWDDGPDGLRVAYRFNIRRVYRHFDIGLRLVRTI